MPESPEEIHARIVAAAGESGRLPMPEVTEWDGLPWEVVDGAFAPKVIGEPLAAEAPRRGTGGTDCPLCQVFTDGSNADGMVKIWESWNLHVVRRSAPSGLPLVLSLQSNEHLDFTDMGDDLAAEYGKVSVWLARIMERLPHIGRVHVLRCGDGAEHGHTWFVARPERLPHLFGSLATEWDEILPPVPEDVWLADVAAVATKLAHHDGRVVG